MLFLQPNNLKVLIANLKLTLPGLVKSTTYNLSTRLQALTDKLSPLLAIEL
jgi:hypothetical protein